MAGRILIHAPLFRHELWLRQSVGFRGQKQMLSQRQQQMR